MPVLLNKPEGSALMIRLLTLLRLLRTTSNAVLTQTSLHAQLLAVEWAKEKQRLLAMLVAILLGFACLLVIMLLSCSVVLALSWETDYRIPAVLALIALHALGLAVAWWHFKRLSALGNSVFAGTRSELAADLALLKEALWTTH